MSSIAAGTSAGSALVSTGDTTGNLVLQVNGTTPSVSLAANGAIGVGSTPGYGTSGQVLTSAGSAAAPTWATPASTPVPLNLTLISSTTVSSATTVFSFTGLSNTYRYYLAYFSALTHSDANVTLYYSSNNGSTYTIDSGAYQRFRWYADTGINGNQDTSAGRILTNSSNYTAQVFISGVGSAVNVSATSLWYNNNQASSGLIYQGGSNAVASNGATVVNAMRFTFSSNVTAGKVFLYGGQP
jgi:hypothetical protein